MSSNPSENKQESTSNNEQSAKPLPAGLENRTEHGANGPATGNGAGGNNGAGNGGAGKWRSPARVELPEVEPWPEPVNGEELLDNLVSEQQRFVVFPKWAVETTVLWDLHTYAYGLREVTTYLGIESPERECGKSTLLTLMSHFVHRPALSSNISPSAFFHVIEEMQPTLLIDEADTQLRPGDELMGILNAGYTKSTGFVWRMSYEAALRAEGERKGAAGARGLAGHVVRYSSWCPKAIAKIGQLDPTLASRCIGKRGQEYQNLRK